MGAHEAWFRLPCLTCLLCNPVSQGGTVPEEDGRPPVYPGVAEPVHVPGQPQQDHPGDGKPPPTPPAVLVLARLPRTRARARRLGWGHEESCPDSIPTALLTLQACLPSQSQTPFHPLLSSFSENLLASILPLHRCRLRTWVLEFDLILGPPLTHCEVLGKVQASVSSSVKWGCYFASLRRIHSQDCGEDQ